MISEAVVLSCDEVAVIHSNRGHDESSSSQWMCRKQESGGLCRCMQMDMSAPCVNNQNNLGGM